MADSTLALLMDRFTRRVHLNLQSKAAEFDTYHVGPGGGMILMLLAETGPITMQDLAKTMVRDKSQMTRAVGPMERKGLIARKPGPHDTRQVIVTLTEDGHAFVKVLREVVAASISDVLHPLPEADQQTLVGLLSRALSDR